MEVAASPVHESVSAQNPEGAGLQLSNGVEQDARVAQCGEDHQALPELSIEADVEVVCKPLRRSSQSSDGELPGPGVEGIFHAKTMQVTCLCQSCQGKEIFTPSQFEAHGGLACNKRWRTSITLKNERDAAMRPLTVGQWLRRVDLDSDCRRTIPKKRWKHSLPAGWTAEHLDGAAGKPGIAFRGTCPACEESQSVQTKDEMRAFLERHFHSREWAGLSPDSFPWGPAESPRCQAEEEPPAALKAEPDSAAAGNEGPGEGLDGDTEMRPAPCVDPDSGKLQEESGGAAGTSDAVDSGLKEPSCKQCGATTTPQWRSGKTLCNACYLRERKDKLLGKRRATAPAGFQAPCVLVGSGSVVPAMASGAQGVKPPSSPPASQGPQLPMGGFAASRQLLCQAPGMQPPGVGWPPVSAGPKDADDAGVAQRSSKFRRTNTGSAAAAAAAAAAFFPHGMLPAGSMHASLGGWIPPASLGSVPMVGMAPGLSHAAFGGAAGAFGSHHMASIVGQRGNASPEAKPTFSTEESVIRQVSRLDDAVAEAYAMCCAGFGEQRCAARDRGYELGRRAMREKVSHALADIGGRSDDEGEQLRKSLKSELEESLRVCGEHLLEALMSSCKGIVSRWKASQVASVLEACEEGQRIAREDFTKFLYECMNRRE
uniref:GATA-type domain-containing protein n=1 Tax=Tetraselmis sp. GSL018 TaxID=582737 RepID=A0A061S3H5_9CHLO